jgi:hypothetical protein
MPQLVDPELDLDPDNHFRPLILITRHCPNVTRLKDPPVVPDAHRAHANVEVSECHADE